MRQNIPTELSAEVNKNLQQFEADVHNVRVSGMKIMDKLDILWRKIL